MVQPQTVGICHLHWSILLYLFLCQVLLSLSPNGRQCCDSPVVKLSHRTKLSSKWTEHYRLCKLNAFTSWVGSMGLWSSQDLDNREQCGLFGLESVCSPKTFKKINFKYLIEQTKPLYGPQSVHRPSGWKSGWCHLPSNAEIPSRIFLIDGHLASVYTLVVTEIYSYVVRISYCLENASLCWAKSP